MDYIACKVIKKKNVVIVKENLYPLMKILLYACKYFALVILKLFLIENNRVYL